MNQKIVLSFVGIMLIVCSNELLGQGAVIEVSLKDGRNFEGELVSVRESTLVIYTVELKAGEISAVQVQKYEIVPHELITRVTLTTVVRDTGKAGLRVLKVLVGAAAVSIVISGGDRLGGGRLVDDRLVWDVYKKSVFNDSQSSERIINNPAKEDFSWLKSLARFSQDEPEYLQNVK